MYFRVKRTGEYAYLQIVESFREKGQVHHNHWLYIYDGELVPEPHLKDIIEATPGDDDVVILHHQELAALN